MVPDSNDGDGACRGEVIWKKCVCWDINKVVDYFVPEVWKQAFVNPIQVLYSYVRQKIIIQLVLHQQLEKYLSV